MKKTIFTLLLFLATYVASAGEIKNVIFIVPDGTSIPALSLARWYQQYNHPERTALYLDPLICGLVTTHSSNAPIGDSAPTMSCYMTGYRSQTGFISMSPPSSVNDIYPIDSSLAYSPQMTVMEAARIEQNKAIGIVFTCEFPHATPAATSSSWYNRQDYEILAKQMVSNNIDVVMGGGTAYLSAASQSYLKENGYDLFLDDLQGFRNNENPKTWSLFADQALPNDMDRDTTRYPSLAEMTRKAISLLSQNDEGFFLMVEASKIDWAAHLNDPMGIISEVLAFDRAVEEAVEFAKANGETLVVIAPDHGCGGISIGNQNSDRGYDRLSLSDIFAPLSRATKTAEGLVEELFASYRTEATEKENKERLNAEITRYWGIVPTSSELDSIYTLANQYSSTLGQYTPTLYSSYKNISVTLAANMIQSRSYIGFTTHGHTGENVFLAAYDPSGEIPRGVLSAVALNHYLKTSAGIKPSLDSLTEFYYAPAKKLFGNEYRLESDPQKGALTVKSKKHTIVLSAYSNMVSINGLTFQTKTPAIYVDKTNGWYVSREVMDRIDILPLASKRKP